MARFAHRNIAKVGVRDYVNYESVKVTVTSRPDCYRELSGAKTVTTCHAFKREAL